MKLRFVCSTHRRWLESDIGAAQACWLSSYNQALGLSNALEKVKAVNYAGSALEAAELLIFTHGRYGARDIHRFIDSAVLLCHTLSGIEQPRLVCGVIGGSIARLQELLLQGIERTTVLQGCHRLLTVADESPLQSQAISCEELTFPSIRNVH